MIRNQWYAVLESREVNSQRPTGVVRLGDRLVFWRKANGEVVCQLDRCPHLGAKLSDGKVKPDRLACPFHGFEYDPTGQCRFLPAYGRNGVIPKALKAVTLPARDEFGWIWVWYGEEQVELPSINWFDIDDSFSQITFHEHWNMHYSRMIENQLDVMHLTFVHPDTIGRGQRWVVDGPQVQMDGDCLKVWVYNREDDGTPPRKAEDIPEPARPPFLVFNFPNVWENRISEDMRIVAVFAPVDDENTVIYIRNYQRMVNIPVLRELFNGLSKVGSIHILHQDRHVVLGQQPKRTTLKKMGDKLMQGDKAILTYRIHRYELQQKAGQIQED